MWARNPSAPAGGSTLSVRRPGSSNSLALAPSGVTAPQPTRLLLLLLVFHLSPRGIESPASPCHPPPHRGGVQEGRKRESALGSRSDSGMEIFEGVRFVQLRSLGRPGEYLAADTDGIHVCVTDELRTHNTVWAVEHFKAYDGTKLVALRGAYGRYMVAGDRRGAIVRQAALDRDDPTPRAFLWQPATWQDNAVLRSATDGFLSPDGKFHGERRTVITADYTGSTMMLWRVESIPVRLTRPSIRDAVPQLLHHHYGAPPHDNEFRWTLNYYVANAEADGSFNFNEEGKQLRLKCKDLLLVRNELSEKLKAPADMTLCVRAGRHGGLTPLLLDLPDSGKNNTAIDVFILPYGTPDLRSLRSRGGTSLAAVCCGGGAGRAPPPPPPPSPLRATARSSSSGISRLPPKTRNHIGHSRLGFS
ncbi:hypothetical protein ACP4OV_029168 [Aristida adscensionis]